MAHAITAGRSRAIRKTPYRKSWNASYRKSAARKQRFFGSGRTDAGTHATGQVMNFRINWNGTAEQLLDAFQCEAARGHRGGFHRGNAPSFPQQTQRKGEALFLFHLDWQAFACVLSENIPSVVRKRLMFRQCGRRRQPSSARMISKASVPIKE